MPSGVYVRTQAHRDATRKAMTGVKMSDAHRAAIKASLASPLVRDQIALGVSKALKGKPKSKEHAEKVRMANIGKRLTDSHKLALSISHKGNFPTAETRKKLSDSAKLAYKEGRCASGFNEESRRKVAELAASRTGDLHPRWVFDRTTLSKRNTQRTTADLTWSRNVKSADKHKCVLASSECCGRLEAHHILDYVHHPEKRLDVGNGVTVCNFHHPRKLSKATAMIPIFQEIVAIRKASN